MLIISIDFDTLGLEILVKDMEGMSKFLRSRSSTIFVSLGHFMPGNRYEEMSVEHDRVIYKNLPKTDLHSEPRPFDHDVRMEIYFDGGVLYTRRDKVGNEVITTSFNAYGLITTPIAGGGGVPASLSQFCKRMRHEQPYRTFWRVWTHMSYAVHEAKRDK